MFYLEKSILKASTKINIQFIVIMNVNAVYQNILFFSITVYIISLCEKCVLLQSIFIIFLHILDTFILRYQSYFL